MLERNITSAAKILSVEGFIPFNKAEGSESIGHWKVDLGGCTPHSANAVIEFNRVDTLMDTQGGQVHH